MHQQHQGISSISTTAASAHQQYKQHQRISALAHQQHQRISSISSISASAVAALLAHQQYDDDDVIYHESWCWWWIYDSKQKRPALHTSERTIVPRTVIFFGGVGESVLRISFFSSMKLCTIPGTNFIWRGEAILRICFSAVQNWALSLTLLCAI